MSGPTAGVDPPAPVFPAVHGPRLTDEQAALAPTASVLCLGGLIKHVAETEEMWMNFAVGGAEAMSYRGMDQDSWTSRFDMTGDRNAGSACSRTTTGWRSAPTN